MKRQTARLISVTVAALVAVGIALAGAYGAAVLHVAARLP